jgi:hypothetical protein
MPHCQGATGFQHSAPPQNDEIALPGEVDDGCAGLPFGDRRPDLDPGLCTADRTHPIEKFLRPRRLLMVGLVEIARRDQRPVLGWPLSTGRRNVQHNKLGRGL